MSTIISVERIQGLLLTAPSSITPSFINEFPTILGDDPVIYSIIDASLDTNAEFETEWPTTDIIRNAVGKEMIKNLVEGEWDFTEQPIALLKNLSEQKIHSAQNALTTWKLFNAFSMVLKISAMQHHSSVNQRMIQLKTRKSIAKIVGQKSLMRAELRRTRKSIDDAQERESISKNERSRIQDEEGRAKKVYYKLKREAHLLVERYELAKQRSVLGKPCSKKWNDLPLELWKMIMEFAFRFCSPKAIRGCLKLDPILRTWTMNKTIYRLAIDTFYRYCDFVFKQSSTGQYLAMTTVKYMTINWQLDDIRAIKYVECANEQPLAPNSLIWFMWLGRCDSLKKLTILYGMHRTISSEALNDIPFFTLPSSLRKVRVIYDSECGCEEPSKEHKTMYQNGKKTYTQLTNFLALRLSSWSCSSGTQRTVFRRQPEKRSSLEMGHLGGGTW